MVLLIALVSGAHILDVITAHTSALCTPVRLRLACHLLELLPGAVDEVSGMKPWGFNKVHARGAALVKS